MIQSTRCWPYLMATHSMASLGRGTGAGVSVATEVQVEQDPCDLDPRRTGLCPADFSGTVLDLRHSRSLHVQYASAARNTTSEPANNPPYGTANTRQDAHVPTTGASSTRTARPYVTIETNPQAARIRVLGISMSAPAVVTPLTALKSAVAHRRLNPRTPLNLDLWDEALQAVGLTSKYHLIPMSLKCCTHTGIPIIKHTFTPPNKDSTEVLNTIFHKIIQVEFTKGRYIGPFSHEEFKHEISPFQSSPLLLVPKSGKPGKYCLIQNLLFPHSNIPTPSINSYLNSNNFPCTWGTFRTIATLIRGLPSGAQVAICDIAESYQIIPLHESQWPGIVVCLTNNLEQFALNTCNSFGCTTAGGLFGFFGDALADIL